MELFLTVVILVMLIYFGAKHNLELEKLNAEIRKLKSVISPSTETPKTTPAPTPAVPMETSVNQTTKIIPENRKPIQKKALRPPRCPSEFEKKAIDTLKKIWNWLLLGSEKRPDSQKVESQIITVWLIRASVLLLLIGIAFFIKYSHENNLIPPEIRLAAGVILAIVMIICGSLSINKKYRTVGMGLIGCGIGALYFAGFAGVALYRLIPFELGMAFMIFTTASGVILAIRHNALPVAVIGTLGGYATPFLLHTGSRNLNGLFGYFLLLGIGTLATARHKNWKLLNLLSFVITYAVLILVNTRIYRTSDFKVMIIYSVLFFLLFAILPIIYNFFKAEKITLLELLMMIFNFLFFLGGTASMVEDKFGNFEYASIAALGCAGFFLIQFKVILQRKIQDKNLFISFSTLGLTALGIGFAMLFSGSILVAVLAIQALAMVFLGIKTQSRFLKILALLLYVICISPALHIIFNATIHTVPYFSGLLERMLNLGVYSASLIASYFILKKSESTMPMQLKINYSIMSFLRWMALFSIMIFCLNESAFFTGHFQSVLQFSVISIVFAGALLFVCCRCSINSKSKWMNLLLFISAIICMLVIMIILIIQLINVCHQSYNTNFAFIRIITYLIISGLFLGIGQKFNAMAGKLPMVLGIGLWFTYSSWELYDFLSIYLKDFALGGVSILWAIYSLILLIIGLKCNHKSLRICGFAIFIAAGIKAIFIDLNGFDTIYRIIGFMAIGVLMLAGAILYIKFDREWKRND